MSQPLILCYHGVSDEWENMLAVRTRAFERQLRGLLRRRFRFVSASEALTRRGRLIHVTFDDAYRSVGVNALPVLERLRVPATIFAVTDFAVDEGRFDVPELQDDLAAHPQHLATMTWEELRSAAERGFEIGSHTAGHAHLPELGAAELERELRESRTKCEDELGRACRFLAYPYGEHDARVQAAAERAGYEAAFALRMGAQRGNLFAWPRVDIYRDDTTFRTTMKTSPFRRLLTSGLDRMRRVQG